MPISSSIKDLLSEYNKRKFDIKNRLKEFESLHKGKDEDIFQELCFCLLTPQSKAVYCDKAIKELRRTDMLFNSAAGQIRPKLKGMARFHNKKAGYIVGARNIFKDGECLSVKKRLDLRDALLAREWLVENIKGLGYKEASHFLRNIGLGQNIAILDRHILKNLIKYGVISRIPPSLGSKKTYLEIEEKVRSFCKAVNIPLEELDLLFWSIETGFIFK
jgi:N-glycosylase/DNA lyase